MATYLVLLCTCFVTFRLRLHSELSTNEFGMESRSIDSFVGSTQQHNYCKVTTETDHHWRTIRSITHDFFVPKTSGTLYM